MTRPVRSRPIDEENAISAARDGSSYPQVPGSDHDRNDMI
jgi:hypothetical protein